MKISYSRTVGINRLSPYAVARTELGTGTNLTNGDPQRNTGGTNALVNNLNLNTGFGNTAFGDSALLDDMIGDNNTATPPLGLTRSLSPWLNRSRGLSVPKMADLVFLVTQIAIASSTVV